MRGRVIKRGFGWSLGALVSLCVLPALAGAETRTFLSTVQLTPGSAVATFGPANVFPSGIVVSGVRGKVTKATVTLIGYHSSAPDDADIVLRGPTGPRVMLMSDTCGTHAVFGDDWIFDDSARTFLSDNGPCADGETKRYRPSNYLGNAPEPDDLSSLGGPAPPYKNALSLFNGKSPNGVWNLYADDDNPGIVGFEIPGWALNLRIKPPPTGRRAAALKKCKQKRTAAARRQCRKRAKKLPV